MNFPRPQLLSLPDGRQIEYARYGAAAGPAAFFFHGFIGSHFQASCAHEAALKHGVQLIAPNRPFVGRSSAARRDSVAEHVPDVAALADALGLGRFAVIGASGGAPYALACLAKMPQRCRVGVLVSGLGPVAEPAVLELMPPFIRQALVWGRRFPWVLRGVIGVQRRRVQADAEGVLAQLIRRWSATDRGLFGRDDVRRALLGDLKQVFVEGRPEQGLSQEVRLYFRWGFRLADVPADARVLLWHGLDDEVVPAEVARHAARQLHRPEVTLQPGGHFMVIDHADEVMRRTREALRA